MIYNIFRRKGLPKYVSEIVENWLKTEIRSFEVHATDSGIQSYTVMTNRGYLDLRISTNEERISIEKAILILCKKNNIPAPNISFDGKVDYENNRYFFLVEDFLGEPLSKVQLHVFDYNRVLSQAALYLLNIHKIRLTNFGLLNANLEGTKRSWQDFISQDISLHLETLQKKQILKSSTSKKIFKILTFKDKYIFPTLLHNNFSSEAICIDDNLNIVAIRNFVQPLSGDPNYEIAGFLIYEGFDRAKRLMNSYYLQGGMIEIDSEDFLKTALRRAIGTLYWKEENEQGGNYSSLQRLIYEIVSRMNRL